MAVIVSKNLHERSAGREATILILIPLLDTAILSPLSPPGTCMKDLPWEKQHPLLRFDSHHQQQGCQQASEGQHLEDNLLHVHEDNIYTQSLQWTEVFSKERIVHEIPTKQPPITASAPRIASSLKENILKHLTRFGRLPSLI